jgi:hypothetical protein
LGYVRHHQGLYRTGFRPRLTNTFMAAQLNGITPFDPEPLRLGQHKPFSAGGGYGLNGLGDIVPDLSIVTYRGAWTPGSLRSGEAMLGVLLSALTEDGFAILEASSDATPGGQTFEVTLQLQVNNGQGFNNPNHILAIIQQEVFTATGVRPIADSILSVHVPRGGHRDPSSPQQQSAPWIFLGLGLLLLGGRRGR